MGKNEWTEKWDCPSGYREVTAFIDFARCFGVPVETNVDVCADEFDLGTDISEKRLAEVIAKKPERIYDMYVDKNYFEEFRNCKFKLHKKQNALYRTLDRSATIAHFKPDATVVDILPLD